MTDGHTLEELERPILLRAGAPDLQPVYITR
jgi:hypothetical protein